MKKILLATTAVAGVAALAAQASAAEAPTLSISGSVEYQYNFYDNDDDNPVINNTTGGGTGAVNSLGQDIRQDNVTSAIIFNASGTADNGLTYGALFDFRMNVTNDESYLYFADSWGRIHFGDDDGATANLTYGGEAALAGTGGFDGNAGNYWQNNGVSAVSGPSTTGATDDSSKLVYYTPNFSGFAAAASFSPDTGFTNATNAAGVNSNIIEVAATYDGNFDAISLGLNAGYRHATASEQNEDVSAFEVGGKIGFGGFTIAGAYGDNGDSGCATGTAGCDAGFYWDVGVGYGAGPFKVGAGYFASEANAGGAATKDDEVEIFTVGGTYTIAQGLIAFAEYNNGEFTNGANAGAANETLENQGFLIGSRVSF